MSSDPRLAALLRETEVPGEREAEERAHAVTRAAFAARQPSSRWRRTPPLGLIAAAAIAALVALALTPPGRALSNRLRDGIAREEPRRAPRGALLSLPADGRLLVLSGEGPWIVRRDGSRRLLRGYGEATWSPRGLFVAAARGGELSALDAKGGVRWTLPRSGPVQGMRWSPSGFRIAYLNGDELRVVAGDGSGDRRLRARVAEVPPAWSPSGLHVVAFADRAGSVRVVAADTGRELWRSRAGERPDQLAWSSDGQRLVALADRSLRIFDGRGRLLRTIQMPNEFPPPLPTHTRMVAFAPGGHRFALVRESAREPGVSLVVLIDAERRPGRPVQLAAGRGAFTDLAWSPDGHWLAVAWPSADELIFVSGARIPRLLAVTDAARRFTPAGERLRFPELAGWCCAGAAGP